ncbi:glyoxalase [Secundilactobacillus pentosiphilus]|uniref:Glyoxalase n=1 Tax=Secundilactobacillus pentosiphilus TaxID=1714682 RepID=A0A1Z5IMG8_9LACO|nr:VOC family protein [Secundilactobacillus pentosiphilus]GAX02601.1 glyoxalase [Secundilactobacillus pentosiphilus]GAX06510.1 glyoxalase [Secundilactobacillus pentosiphilus]
MALTDYVTGIQHVGIPSKDLDVTIAFYKKLGFKVAGLFHNGENRCAFLQLGNYVIETWEGDPVVEKTGAINHCSLNTTDVDKAFEAVKKLDGVTVLDDEIQSIPSFWKHGIRFFNILGPNHEKIEFCEKLAQ